MANLNAPSSTAGASARAPSPSTASTSTGRRLSTKGRALKRFLRRLIPPFSAAPSSSPSQPTTSEGTTDTATTEGEQPKPSTQPPASQNTDQKTTDDKMALTTLDNETNKQSLPTKTENGTASAMAKLSLEGRRSYEKPVLPNGLKLTAEGLKSSAPKPVSIHQEFMDQALDMARLALRTNETPVGCVLVHKNKVIAKGMNATNVTRNGTRHAEFMAVSALLSYRPEGVHSDDSCAEPRHVPTVLSAEAAAARERDKDIELGPDPSLNDSEYVRNGHLYPYGQKIHTDPRVPRSIIAESVLYVTVEPCVMCASLLRQLGIRKVYFGAVNDKFGGAGGVFSIHLNSIRPQELAKRASGEEARQKEASALGAATNGQGQTRPPVVHWPDKQQQKSTSGQYHQPQSNPDGDGGNVEPGFEIEGGWGRDEAIGLLRRFYVQENGRAPQPRKKEGRAARLAAMEQGIILPSDLQTGATPGETGAGDTAAEANKTALDAEIAEIPLQQPVLEGKQEPAKAMA
ncbi:hypothetical protein F5X68DRAFT_274989 [Plectosphaerella plurivora]|uniref:CMP/dCMP-type deaminase domain-containing protein n=1 Tax=Plectosphaerella plurivora TaxID=936078 RepID=A0A9P8VE38_9PEZI|nr:hypothetical protein F5X68DRAFT_274989 [Plectosphaerella plurivora]